MKKGIIFDLDGVIVDTAKYHYLAWKKMAAQFGYDFTEEIFFTLICINPAIHVQNTTKERVTIMEIAVL